MDVSPNDAAAAATVAIRLDAAAAATAAAHDGPRLAFLPAIASGSAPYVRPRQAHEEEARYRWPQSSAQFRQKAWSNDAKPDAHADKQRAAPDSEGQQPDRPRDQQAAPQGHPLGA